MINTKDILTVDQDFQVILRSAMYLGSEESSDRDILIFRNNQFIMQDVKFQYQPHKLFEELLQNSLDNYFKLKEPQQYYINIIATKRFFSIQNNGPVFELSDNNQQNINNIDRIFGVLNTSSNYLNTDQNISSGRNGLGAKLVNIFSKQFTVQVQNVQYNNNIPQSSIIYTTTWKQHKTIKIPGETKQVQFNLQKVPTKTIKNQMTYNNYFKVEVEMLDQNTIVWDKDHKIKKVVNLSDLNLEYIYTYIINLQMVYPNINFFFNNQTIPKLTLKQWLQMLNIQTYIELKVEKTNQLKVILFDKQTSILKTNLSIINGAYTFLKDGAHYNNLQNIIKKKNPKDTLTFTNIGQIYLGNYVVDFEDQTKQKISTQIPVEYDKKIMDIVQQKTIKVTTTKNKSLFIEKLRDAISIKDKSVQCVLIIAEGDSAIGIFKIMGQKIPNFNNKYGTFPLKGKIKNVFNIPFNKIINEKSKEYNKEIYNLVRIIGLNQNTQSVSELRYQKVLIASDYDVDGFHIKGLFINFINAYWPHLIEQGFLQEFITPIVVAKNDEYFSYEQFQQHKHKYQPKDIIYYKGLGSFNTKQIIQMGQNLNKYIKHIIPTINQQQLISRLFDPKIADERKQLITDYQYIENDRSEPTIDIEYLMNQVIEYSVSVIYRAIPDFMDGLKDSQRKIVYHMLNIASRQKVANLASDVSAKYDYHHGETSLQQAIVMLAQDFTGSNNYSLLQPDSNFGSRQDPESVGAPRYIFVFKGKIMELLFHKDDELIYEYNKSDENQDIEPKRLYPLIPIQLLNGVKGIATGWSTECPQYNIHTIIELIEQILKQINNKTIKIENPIPWYRGFQGTIEAQTKNYINKGKYEYNQQKLTVYDTHIKTSISDLRSFINDKLQMENFLYSNKLIIPNCNEELFQQIYKKYLETKISTTNMTFIDPNSKVIQFNTVNKLLIEWVKQRLNAYALRIDAKLKQLAQQYIILFNQIRLIYGSSSQSNKPIDKRDLDISYLNNPKKFSERIIYYTPQSKIQEIVNNQQSISQIKQYLQQQETNKQTVEDKGEYSYIKSKPISFYHNLSQQDLIDIEKQYNIYANLTPEQLYQQDINEIKNQIDTNIRYKNIKSNDDIIDYQIK